MKLYQGRLCCQWRNDDACWAELDEIVDEALMKYNNDLELAIDHWRPLSKSTPEFESRKCGGGYVRRFVPVLHKSYS